MFKKTPINKKFMSFIDEALNEFNRTYPPSPAQQAEIDKYQQIYQLRDHATPLKKDKDMWDFEG
ncbi:MAG: hypothetical protein A3F10_07315 [Coxiella sp. RIFCSPHIGHO2_12_FULL_42_15]|nr:MAG: hypothetical protein A3F10_07315 [Coxiella sp. RIFCSPHIGHO2_12_FULL_42_15]